MDQQRSSKPNDATADESEMENSPGATSPSDASAAQVSGGKSRGRRFLTRFVALTLVLVLIGLAITSQFRSEIETGTEVRLPEAIPTPRDTPPIAAPTPVTEESLAEDAAEPAEDPVRSPRRPTPMLTTGEGKFDRQQFVGRWVLNDSIRRDVIIDEDGTATMDVDLDFVSSFFYGSHMELSLSWQLQDDILTHTLLSGEPKNNVDKLVKDFGNVRSYRVISIDDEAMVLEDAHVESPERHRWVKQPVPSSSQTRVDGSTR